MSDADKKRDLSRRSFLKLAGGATAAAGCSVKPAAQKLIPYLVPPENVVPGTPMFYRTVCRECPAGCGVTARTREGRVVKLEGNPEDPIGRGALCARGQAALQGLYAPDRLKGPLRRGSDGSLAPTTWDQATQLLANALAAAKGKDPSRIRMITRAEPGSAGALHRAFMESLGAGSDARVVLEPFDLAALRAAGGTLFDRAELPAFKLGEARSVVAFGADFLETWLSPVELTRGLSEGRGRVGPERTRFTWVGPRLSMTGVSADRWLRTRPGGELWLALGLLRWLVDPTHGVGGLGPDAGAVFRKLSSLDPAEVERESGVPAGELEALAHELAGRRPSALLGPGVASSGTDAAELAVVIQLVNHLLGNVGATVLYGLDPREDPPSPFSAVQSLVEDLAAGRVDVLLVHHADPVGALPAALGAAAALGKVPLVVSFSDRLDPTTGLAHLVLPDHHPLESLGDVSPRKGVVTLSQPVMNPLGDTRATSQVLLDLGAKLPLPAAHFPYRDFYEYTQTRAETYAMLELGASGDLIAHHRRALARGGYYSEARPEPVALLPEALGWVSTRGGSQAAGEGMPLLVFPTSLRYDGRSADLPWLKEVPDPLTSLSWISWAELSPATAASLGVTNGDVVTIQTHAGAAELPAYVFAGVCDGAVAVPLGAPEVTALLSLATDQDGLGPAWQGGRTSVRRAGRRVRLPVLEGSPSQHGRNLLPVVTAAEPALPHRSQPRGMSPDPAHPLHRWAMAIDLDRCTGCQACVVACYAENNIPVVGPERAAEGRSMGWIRLERYFGSPKGKLRVDLLPMLCQQCGSAPCETVCPVYATYHSDEGLNAQVYNRCVGTRYCSNNCPYKVRVFNWQEPAFPAPLNMQLNPDVSVRSKGVMEKCTFCVQRIRYAENAAKDQGRPVADGEVVPACAQTCPAQAIVFGDADDPSSRVSQRQRDPRGFHALDDANTRPAVTYLARVQEDGS